MPSRRAVEDFLAQRVVAVVGVSRSPKSFSESVVGLLEGGGRTVHRVNRHGGTSPGGAPVYAHLRDVPGPVDGVLVLVDASSALEVVREAVAAGVPRVWLHRGSGRGAVDPEAVRLCREAGVDVVDGACPFMFAEPVRGVHRLHRALAGRHLTA